MDESAFQKKLGELVDQIESLPESERDRLRQIAAETQQRHEKMKASFKSLQDSIDYLRLGIKYLMFDLEATRRENAYLRKMLEQESSGGEKDADGEKE
ncbi:MAG: hypothetical protein SF069_00855 [Phycisphaerae bacterium]|nr:hypothetical protein [Phycisphaerae bacterium]